MILRMKLIMTVRKRRRKHLL